MNKKMIILASMLAALLVVLAVALVCCNLNSSTMDDEIALETHAVSEVTETSLETVIGPGYILDGNILVDEEETTNATGNTELSNKDPEQAPPSETTKPTTPTPTTKPTTPTPTTKPTTPTPTTKPTTPTPTTKPTTPTPTTKPTTPPATKPTTPSEPTKPTVPSEPTKPTTPSEPTTKPTTPPDTAKPAEVTYEEYMALSPEAQQEFFESFASVEEYFDWFNAAKAEYETNRDFIEIDGSGSIDIGEIIGGNG